ncbi:MAG TPA: tetratricopeptide repeat protein [Dissulfurispiraceae bacterium]|nr:tetratricopeptide repeat protein [Dissulfurispiraceae bacterium]
MSLLADLLAKLNQREGAGDIPPGLRRIVQQDAQKKTMRKRIISLSVLMLAVILLGIGLLYGVKSYINAPVRTIAQTPVVSPSAPPIPPRADAVPQETLKQVQKDRGTTPEVAPAPPKAAPAPDKGGTPAQKDGEGSQIGGLRQTIRSMVQPSDRRTERDLALYTAKTHEARRDYPQALADYQRALELDPKNYVIMNNVAGTLLRMGRPGDATSFAAKALSMKADYVPAMINLGAAYAQTGNSADAERYLTRAAALDPANRPVLINLALLYEKAGESDRAVTYYTRLADFRDAQGMLGLARIAERQGRRADAVRLYREILSLEGTDAASQRIAADRLNALGQ